MERGPVHNASPLSNFSTNNFKLINPAINQPNNQFDEARIFIMDFDFGDKNNQAQSAQNTFRRLKMSDLMNQPRQTLQKRLLGKGKAA